MTISSYLCHVVGESPERVSRQHQSTIRRLKAFAIAIHIPVLLWAVTGYVIANRVFAESPPTSLGIAICCALLIYLVERLVLACPKTWSVNLGRVLMGILIAILGACTVDLLIFEREIAQELREAGRVRIEAEFDRSLESQKREVERKRITWMAAQQTANCEANGTCGSRIRNVGPVYRELARQADFLRAEYAVAQDRLRALQLEREGAITAWHSSSRAIDEAGLLARLEALHHYTMARPAAFSTWVVFFTLVLSFELIVVMVKLVFGETVDDQIERLRGEITLHTVREHTDAVTSPLAHSRSLIGARV